MTGNHKYTEFDQFEAISQINMILYYQEGLRRVLAGENIFDVFSTRERTELTRVGIVNRKKGANFKNMEMNWFAEAILTRFTLLE